MQRSRWYLPLLVVLACAVAGGVSAAAASAAGTHHHQRARHYRVRSTPSTLPFRTAVFDPFLMPSLQQDVAYHLLRAAGGTYARILVRWSTIAPATLPTGFDAADPTSAGYSWSWLDDSVVSAKAAGITPILDIMSPPAWSVTPGTINPKIGALGQFATALATHYDGKHGAPAEHVFQVWNEPNLSLDLDPVSPVTYRSMVNAVAASAHAVNAKNIVVAGDLDPFNNTTKRFHTMAPLQFMRTVLCMSKGTHPHSTCKSKIQFDVWSHHPYSYYGPFGHAKAKDDVSIGDLSKMNALLQAAVKQHHVVSAHPPEFWVTEFGWDTNPPRAHAAPLNLEARWTSEAFYQMWRSGVSLVTWFMLQDQATQPWQSGLFFNSPKLAGAKAKPMRIAFRFPFVAYLGPKTVSVWGRDATSNKKVVTIQLRHGKGGPWKTVAHLRSNRYGIFLATLTIANASKKDWLRAVAPGSGPSLPFSLTRDKPKQYISPWGKGK